VAEGVGNNFGVDCSDVSENRDIWPVLSQDGSAIGIDLAEGDGSHSSPLESEREAADAGKKVEDIHLAQEDYHAQWNDLPLDCPRLKDL
jgi:hypothetical protein